jgi:CHASE2 domain-containing sensor protein/tRNA A-37 threonylcarbamoyl transferase component Bud32
MVDKSTKLDIAICSAIVLLFVVFSLKGLSIFDSLERRIYDFELKFNVGKVLESKNIVLVDIDDHSIAELGPWPWPRDRISSLIDLLKEKGARLIGLNAPFFDKENQQGLLAMKALRESLSVDPLLEKDNTFKSRMQENLTQIEETLNNDHRLIKSVKESGNVILPIQARFGGRQMSARDRDYPVLSKNVLASSNLSPSLDKRLHANYITLPYPELASSALGLGHTHLILNNIMSGRIHAAFISYNGSLLPSFPLRLAIAYLDEDPGKVKVTKNRIQMKNRSIPLAKGEMLVKFQDVVFPRLSFVDLSSAKSLPLNVKGKIVIIGFNDLDSKQINTPISSRMPESDLMAYILTDILNSRFVARPFFMQYIEIIVLLLLGIFAGVVLTQKMQLSRVIWTIGLILLMIVAGVVLLAVFNVWFKTAYIISSLIVIYLFLSLKQLFIARESSESTRLIGLSYQNQGLLDLAFDKFCKLPFNEETKNLIYNLGLELEKKRQIGKAVLAYEYVNKNGGFKDLDIRIPKLKELDKSSTIGSYDGAPDGNILVESSNKAITKVGRYEILEQLGRGSMGLVFKAQDPKINRLVAIKTIRFSDEFEDDVIQEIKERFFREAEIAGQLSHPSIVTIHDVGDDQDLTYMAMEFLEGEDLDKFIDKETLLPLRKVLDVVAKVADALDFAHKNEVIHRDIKPANIMLLKNGQIKVTDFGIAKAISSSRTKTGVILGTPNYMSPEQIMGQKIDARSDIFSLGVLFFQLITGELPFHGDNLSGLLYQITQVKHPSPRNFNPKVPKICEQIIDKAMAKNPDNRFQSAADMARIIRLLCSKIDELKEKRSIKK